MESPYSNVSTVNFIEIRAFHKMASEQLKTNEMALRGCILYEYLEGRRPIFEAFKHFCKIMGDDTVEYLDFEYWFMRFSRGEFDLNYDRSLDPKYSRSLSDMPVEIFAKIMENTSWKDVLSIRQVSPSFHNVVDDIKFHYKKLHLHVKRNGPSFSIDNVYHHYAHIGARGEDPDDYWAKTVKKAYHDLRTLITILNIHFDEFEVSFNTGCKYEDLHSTINLSMDPGNLLKTRRIFIGGYRGNNWFQCLEPGTLEEVEIKNPYSVAHVETDVLETEQWKQAKKLIIKRCAIDIPIEHFCHFACIDVEFYGLMVYYFLELKNALFKSARFEKCSIKWLPTRRWDLQDFKKIEEHIGRKNRKEQIDPNYYHYVIKKDKKKFEIKIGPTFAEIERIPYNSSKWLMNPFKL